MRFLRLLLGILCSGSASFLGHYIAISLNFPDILLFLPQCHSFYQGLRFESNIVSSPSLFKTEQHTPETEEDNAL